MVHRGTNRSRKVPHQREKGNLKRHKRTTERQKAISEQSGAVQCPVCVAVGSTIGEG